MFIPNRTCHIRRKLNSYTRDGQPNYGPKQSIRYAMVRRDTRTEDTTVRADSSATRGNSKEFVATGRLLVKPSVKPNWGDILIVEGRVYRVREVETRFNVNGKLDHYEIDFEKAEDMFGDEK